MSLEETLQDPEALREYVDRELERQMVVNWLKEKERTKIDITANGIKGKPTLFDFLTPGWQEAYASIVWKRAGMA